MNNKIYQALEKIIKIGKEKYYDLEIPKEFDIVEDWINKELLKGATKTKQKLKINFTIEDLEDLMNNLTFDWTFITDKGENIDIHLFLGEEEE